MSLQIARAEILSHIINCMNSEQFEEVENKDFLLMKISKSLLSLFGKYHFSRLEMQTFYLIHKNMQFEVLNTSRRTSKTPVGFQLFICFLTYYELHCIHSRCCHVAVSKTNIITHFN